MKVVIIFNNGGHITADPDKVLVVPVIESVRDFRHELRDGKLVVVRDQITAIHAVREEEEWDA